MHVRRLFPTLALSLALSLAATGTWADTCTASPGNNATSGDVHYMNLWQCQQVYIDFFWAAYDFDQGDWDDGFGYEAACDINLPLARTFNALYALHYAAADYATDPDDRNGPILRWGGSYARSHIDELDARCGDGTLFGYTQWGVDAYTDLYLPFFYQLSVPERAGTILHESRHADGVSHDAGTNCPRMGSCDSSWEYNGANRWQVVWLWDYAFTAVDTNLALRDRARDRGNAILAGGFTTAPGFVIPEVPADPGPDPDVFDLKLYLPVIL
jgi:hypothetical protein